MKTIRKEYPKVRQYVKNGHTRYIVDLRRKNYVGPKLKWMSNREAALKYAGAIGEKVAKSGIDSVSQIGVDPRIKAWTEQFAIYNKTLEDGINAALAVFEQERKVKESPYMAELLTVWMDDKISNTLKPLRPRSIKSIRNMANLFQKDFGQIRMKEITHDTIESYLEGKDLNNQTKKNLLNYLGQFFNWAIKKSYHHENPTKKVEITVQNGVPKFFKVSECVEIMKRAKDHDMSSYFALCLFAGIRPNEVERMTWANVDLDTKEIHLNPDQTKTKKGRLFTVSENCIEWLKSLDRKQPLVNPNHKKQKSKVIDGLKCEWINDGLRHSFATFHHAKYKSIELLRHDMGNSPNVIAKFYKGMIQSAEVEKFWNITPQSLAKS